MSDKLQTLDDLLNDLREEAILYGEELHSGRIKTKEEMFSDFGKLLEIQGNINKHLAKTVEQAKKRGFYMACGVAGIELYEVDKLYDKCIAELKGELND